MPQPACCAASHGALATLGKGATAAGAASRTHARHKRRAWALPRSIPISSASLDTAAKLQPGSLPALLQLGTTADSRPTLASVLSKCAMKMQTASIMANRPENPGRREDVHVTSGNTSQRRLALTAGDYGEWNWRERDEHSIDFAVYFVKAGGTKGDEAEVRAMLRRKIDAQSYTASEVGNLVFMFDNVFSWWTDKHISLEIKRVRREDRSPQLPAAAAAPAPAAAAAPAAVPAPAPAVAPAAAAESSAGPDLTSPMTVGDDEAVQELLLQEANWARRLAQQGDDPLGIRAADPEPGPEREDEDLYADPLG